MRKLKIQVQMTVDGFIAGPNGEMDWMALPWTADIEDYVGRLLEPVDTIVLGRKLAEGFIPHWAAVAADPANPEVASGRMFTDTPKIVFTKTLDRTDWPNTVLATGDLAETITRLKQEDGRDICAFGGATFVSALIRHGLIDEFHLFVNPAAIGTGLPIFRQLTQRADLELLDARKFDCGVAVLAYGLKG